MITYLSNDYENLIFNIPANMDLFITPQIWVSSVGEYRYITLNIAGGNRIIHVYGNSSASFMDKQFYGGSIIVHSERIHAGFSIVYHVGQNTQPRIRVGSYTGSYIWLRIENPSGSNFAAISDIELQSNTSFMVNDAALQNRESRVNGSERLASEIKAIDFYCQYTLIIDVWHRNERANILVHSRRNVVLLK